MVCAVDNYAVPRCEPASATVLDMISRPCLYRTVPERHLVIPPEERAPRRVTGYTYLGHSLG